MKIVSSKIFSSVGVFDENVLTTKYCKVKLFVLLLTNLTLAVNLTYLLNCCSQISLERRVRFVWERHSAKSSDG